MTISRSIFTNQFIKSMFDNGGNYIRIDDGDGELQSCKGFKQACEIIDSVEECVVYVSNKYTGMAYGWFMVIPSLDGQEQIADFCQYKNNDFIERRWNVLAKKYGDR